MGQLARLLHGELVGVRRARRPSFRLRGERGRFTARGAPILPLGPVGKRLQRAVRAGAPSVLATERPGHFRCIRAVNDITAREGSTE